MKGLITLILLSLAFSSATNAQTSSFTYQGKLTDGGAGANVPFDFTFKLYAASSGGSQIGIDVLRDDVQVTNGIFTVSLDFGTSPFTSATGNYLEIWVRPGTQTGSYTQLLPRAPITSSPYAVQTINAAQLGGVAASQYVQTTDPRMTDARTPTANSPDYIQNTTSPQATSNFNISGNGTIGGTLTTASIGSPGGTLNIPGTATDILLINRKVTAMNEFRANGGILTHTIDNSAAAGLFFGSMNATSVQIGGTGTLAHPGPDAITLNGKTMVMGTLSTPFGGLLTNNIDTTGSASLSIGSSNATSINLNKPTTITGLLTADGGISTSGNITVGGTFSSNIINATTQYNIGGNRLLSVAGLENLFAGIGAGQSNIPSTESGDGNAFFGYNAGFSNTYGFFNSFFGKYAGLSNTFGSGNAFFGTNAGRSNSTAHGNSFFGQGAGSSNTTGASNTFVGFSAGSGNTTGSNNVFVGLGAGAANATSGSNAFFGYQAGYFNSAGASNAFFGKDAGYSNTAGGGNAFFGTNAGRDNSTGASNAFFGKDAGFANAAGQNNAFFGWNAGRQNTGSSNAFFGAAAGYQNTTGSANAFFGETAGDNNGAGNNNTIVGSFADLGSDNLTNATAIGANAVVSQSNSLVLGSINGINGATSNTNIGIGTTTPGFKLDVVGRARFKQSVENTGPTDSAGFWFFQNTPDVDRAFVGMESDNGVGFFGNNGGGWGLVMNTQTGNVGMGTTAPQQKLHVDGDEVLSTGSGSGFKFRNRGSTSSTDDWVWYSDGNIARLNRAGTGNVLQVTTGGVLTVAGLGTAGSTSLCRNALNQISTCTAGNRTPHEDLDGLREEITKQRVLIDELKKMFCGLKPEADVCKEGSK
jgi:hypothetical protein